MERTDEVMAKLEQGIAETVRNGDAGEDDGSLFPRPTTADLEALREGNTQWNDPQELAVAAAVLQAWVRELMRKGRLDAIGTEDVRCLRQAQLAIRLVA